MSGDETNIENTPKAPKSQKIYLVPFPKFIFMYPTFIVSLLAWAVLAMRGYKTVTPDDSLPVMMTGIFLGVLMLNTFVIVFDFPRATSLTLIFILTTLALGGWMAVSIKPDLLPAVENWVMALRPAANSTFYGCISVAMLLMYIAVFASVRMNYWELSNNELLHHHGILSDLKRYPAPQLRVDKEINDVFEFILLGAGRLILHPAGETRAIVLDNILFVGNKERLLTQALGSIKVKIGNDSA
ncbi:hypothetical protein Poly24_40140 [Rosistilla carotiformis]|uniref:Uncharacterized protein n=1 Tax=Rosistilla carotiformis TaxID=2528017 RepID=A0A518JXM3_9BACT|nr:hypothetical protein [Rosistilla carotiformis]QDV70294.1 hypothetical protein Poly24_40140 [Rosistilla carotiformis]